MENKRLIIEYREYASAEELANEYKELYAKANELRKSIYGANDHE